MVDFGSFADGVADDWVLAPPPLSPRRIEFFGFDIGYRPEESESTISMNWRRPNHIDGTTRVLRRVVPLVAQATPSGFSALTFARDENSLFGQFGWTVVKTIEGQYGGVYNFTDEDVPAIAEDLPKSARRSLGVLYSYKVEIIGGERSARSNEIHTRIRGINRPTITRIEGVSDSEVVVRWRDNSKLASGFEVYSSESGSGADPRTVIINGTTKRELVIRDLAPDSEYNVEVRAWDYYGNSKEHVGWPLPRTDPAPEAEPEDKTFNVSMNRQQIYEGFIPYLGRFPTGGNLPSGTLRKVSLHSAWPALFFVKPGKSTDECNDPSAVVVLSPGTSLTASQMAELYGAETPDLPIVFLACVQATTALYDFIPLRITYRPT